MKKKSFLNEFIRGGQIFTHSLLMFCQVLRSGLLLAFLVFILTFFVLLSHRLTEYDSYIFWQTMEARIRLLIHDHRIKHSIQNPDGSVVELKAVDFIRSPKARYHVLKYQKVFWRAVFQSFTLSLFVLGLYCWMLMIKGKREHQTVMLSGQDPVPPKTLRRLLHQAGEASSLSLAQVPLLKGSETQHLLLVGTTGTGKSVAILELMDQVRQQGKRAIVYDIDGSFIPLYYRPDKDVLLNPLDSRVPAWNLWQECWDLADFETAASAFMPDSLLGHDPFWVRSAQTVFACLGLKLIESTAKATPKTRDFLSLIFSPELKRLSERLSGTPAGALMVETIDKTAASIKATLATHCRSLLYLREEGEEPLFSIRRWVAADRGDSWLFLSSSAQKIEALKSLLSVWLDIAAKSILSLSPDPDRQLWFFLDELASLHPLPSLMTTLSRGRKYGACFVAAIQDIHQLYALYGQNQAESLISLFNTKVLYRSTEPHSALWLSQVVGNREQLEKKEGFSYGAHSMRDGVSIHQERRQDPILPPSAFLELPDLEAFLKLPGRWPVTRLRFEPRKRSPQCPVFLQRELKPWLDLNLASSTNEVEEASTVDPQSDSKPLKLFSRKKKLKTLRQPHAEPLHPEISQ